MSDLGLRFSKSVFNTTHSSVNNVLYLQIHRENPCRDNKPSCKSTLHCLALSNQGKVCDRSPSYSLMDSSLAHNFIAPAINEMSGSNRIWVLAVTRQSELQGSVYISISALFLKYLLILKYT